MANYQFTKLLYQYADENISSNIIVELNSKHGSFESPPIIVLKNLWGDGVVIGICAGT